MSRSSTRALSLVAAALLVTHFNPPASRASVSTVQEYTFHHENVLGTSLELRVRATSAEAASAAETRVLAEIDRLSAIFSTYDSSSEFSRWMAAGKDGRVSPELFDVLKAADRWTKISEGAFDPRVDVLSKLWSAGVKRNQVPSDAEIAQAVAKMATPTWSINEQSRTVRRTSDCPLNLNAIAKGTIIDRACAAALNSGEQQSAVRGALLMVGGDLRARGEISRKVGIARPRGGSDSTEPIVSVEVREGGLATSGDYMRGFRIAGQWYSHIFDPRTGRPASRVISSSVIAPTAETADALATAFSVLPVEKSLAIAESLPGVACMLVSNDGKIVKSSVWARHERPRVVLAASRTVTANASTVREEAWPKGYELSVAFEITQPAGDARRYRRPYVAIWVTDKDGVPVRTVVLWVQKTGLRWLPDLSRWYRDDQLRKLADDADLVQTISKATRAPGKYEATWDGKDDHGKPVPAGDYTINIEVAREHGTHQIIRKELTLGDQSISETLKGNVEIKSAALSYGKKKSGR